MHNTQCTISVAFRKRNAFFNYNLLFRHGLKSEIKFIVGATIGRPNPPRDIFYHPYGYVGKYICE